MADFGGLFLGQDEFLRDGGGVEFPGRVPEAYQRADLGKFGDNNVTLNDPAPLDPARLIGTFAAGPGAPAVTPSDFNGILVEEMSFGQDWFESFHVVRRRYDFGNILSQTSLALEVYSAHRASVETWDTFANNAGEGVTLVGLPSLPRSFNPQEGFSMTLQVDVEGPPSVDTTLDFTFSTPQTINVPITLERVVMLAIPPEMPYTETLEWYTDILEHKDGTEQRISPRKSPRQFFRWRILLDEGRQRSRFENVLFEQLSRQFGIPVWHEAVRSTAPYTISQTVLGVRDTSYGDFRVGGLVVVYTDDLTFDVAVVDAVTSNSVTISSGLANAYGTGTLVAPVRIAALEGGAPARRFPVNLAEMNLNLRVKDNDVDLSDTTPFSSYNSKVLIDTCNLVRGAVEHRWFQELASLDSRVGLSHESALWDVAKRRHTLTLLGVGQQGLWELRGLLHALRGPQTSFYVGTFSDDLQPIGDISGGTDSLVVTNVGYTQFVQSRQARNTIRVVRNDGGADVLRDVISSVEDSSTQETLTVDSNWSGTILNSQIERIEFVEKVRLDSDRVSIDHTRGDRRTRVTSPVVTVLE